MNLSPRNKLIALAAGLFVLIVVLVAVLIVPQFARLGELGAQIEQANDESSEARTLLEQRREVKNQAAVTSNTLLQLANAVPENPELPSLIIELQDAAYASGVSLRSVSPQSPSRVDGESFVSVNLGLEVWGTWADTIEFLERLRKLGREIRVQQFDSGVLDDVTVSNAGLEAPPYYQVRTNVAIVTYVIPAGTTDAPAAVPAPTE